MDELCSPDGSGLLNVSELFRGLLTLGLPLTSSELAGVLDVLDQDGTGYVEYSLLGRVILEFNAERPPEPPSGFDGPARDRGDTTPGSCVENVFRLMDELSSPDGRGLLNLSELLRGVLTLHEKGDIHLTLSASKLAAVLDVLDQDRTGFVEYSEVARVILNLEAERVRAEQSDVAGAPDVEIYTVGVHTGPASDEINRAKLQIRIVGSEATTDELTLAHSESNEEPFQVLC
jgi:hypothetical protein